MKRILLILLLLFGQPGCGREQTVNTGDSSSTQETVYHSDTPSADCYLCGEGIENLIPSYWGQNNIALISLNTFDIKPIEINRYDGITGQLIEEYASSKRYGARVFFDQLSGDSVIAVNFNRFDVKCVQTNQRDIVLAPIGGDQVLDTSSA